MGIIVDEKINWKYHIDSVKGRLSSALFAMRQVKNITTTSLLQTLYYSMFYLHIDYGIILWGGAKKCILHPIIIMQKKAVRLIRGAEYNAHTAPLFALNKMLKLEDIYELQLAKFVYSLYNDLLPVSQKIDFTTNKSTHEYNTRNSYNPKMPKHRTSVAGRSIFTKSYYLWYNMDLS